ncbi:hypothetical protein HJFPF1_04479 [Paramyrothecium foliicola]|nr:hypothetical protein HJFPF1_04479 [Paramyrothecium foliicola]
MGYRQPKFDTFNEAHFSKQPLGPSSFELFAKLSPELRLRIWELCLQNTRLLSIELREIEIEEDAGEPLPRYKSTNYLDNITSGSHYQWAVSCEPRPHALFSTCSESRMAARKHFRVVLPSQQNFKSQKQLYFNPEYDFLRITIEKGHSDLLIDFLFDFKAYDPNNVGILQLAMDQKNFEKLYSITTDTIPHQALKSLKDTLLNLRCIWASCLIHTGARAMVGFFGGTRNYETKLNRSVPIFSFAPEFEWLDTDPRPIEPDLGKTTVFKHPKRMKEAWEYFEDSVLGRKCDQPLQRTFSYALAELTSYMPKVSDKEKMKQYLDMERDHWDKNAEQFCYDWWVEPEDRKGLLSAAGMWVFPDDTFDNLNGIEDGKVIADLRGSKPGLVVANLGRYPRKKRDIRI